MSPSRKADRKGGPDTRPSARLSASQAKKFLATYKEAWETHNSELASQLFTRDAEYRADTFSKPIVGREGICHYWALRKHRAGRDSLQSPQHVPNGLYLDCQMELPLPSSQNGREKRT